MPHNSQFKDRRRNMDDKLEYRSVSSPGSHSLTNHHKPLLAMIRGYCVGGGVGITITCNLRIASDSARVGVPAARLGLGYHYDGIDKLMHLIGPPEVLRMGLVNQLLPRAALESFTRRCALRIAGNAPLTPHIAKATGRELLRRAEMRDLSKLDKMLAECCNSEDYQEGVRTVSEKRRPAFKSM